MEVSVAIRRMRAPHWLGFYGLVLGAWAALYAMRVPPEVLAAAEIYGAEFWQALCTVAPGVAGLPALTAMWAAMAAAMMAPTLLPALATFDDLVQGGAARAGGFAALLAGYLAVWLGFALLAAAAQVALSGAGLLTPWGASAERWFSALLLAGAGAYQFTALKDACLSRCRRPLIFFMAHWAEGPARMGLRLGLACLGCCWALMALAFVGGTMNLAFMGLAMVLMTLEKLPRWGGFLTRPLGFALLAAAALTLLI